MNLQQDTALPGRHAPRRSFMPSIFSHAIVATAIGKVVEPNQVPWWYWVLGAAISAAPDLDVIGFHFGIRYEDVMGHRGFSHSLLFAALLAGLVTVAFTSQSQISCRRLFLYLFLATASHGILDAMTNGGLGVAFFSPFSNTRFFLPFRPIKVSPIGIGRFFSARGLEVVRSEAMWLWLPSAVPFAVFTFVRRVGRRGAQLIVENRH
jgi:inner membrane protein